MAYCHPTELSGGLYCSELQLCGDEAEPLMIEPDLYWEEEELAALLSKQSLEPDSPEIGTPLALVRRRAVAWILKVQALYHFAALTAVLAVNYLDRFLVRLRPWRDQPWMGQLAAVACLTLAAKVEETNVPLLLDFQVDTPYIFEAKTIKRMELLVLSTLNWKMNPVTALSFVDYVIRRLGLKKDRSCSEFLRRCDNLLLSLLPDLKLQKFLPSVVATAAMLQVIDGLQPHLAVECQSQLVGLMAIDKETLECCGELMSSEWSGCRLGKRRYGEAGSPRGVMECGCCFTSDTSDDSWASPDPLLFKKSRRDPCFP